MIVEVFMFEFNMEGEGDFDMLYYYGFIDDIWLGIWGIFCIFEKSVLYLILLFDREKLMKWIELLFCLIGKKFFMV